MIKEVSRTIAAAFFVAALGAPMNVNAAENDLSIEKLNNVYGISEKMQEQIINEADGFLAQLIVQNRYTTATSVVWVYGCADKS